MAGQHACAKWAVHKRLRTALEAMECSFTRGLHITIDNGRVKPDTLWGDGTVTNSEWRSFKVKAADREKAFVEWVRPQVERMVRDIQVHAAVWSMLTVQACIHYFTGELEIDIQVRNPRAFDTMVATSGLKWDTKNKT